MIFLQQSNENAETECFNVWGDLGADDETVDGPQVKFVSRLISRVSAAFDDATYSYAPDAVTLEHYQ
jgi:hypothetical protein